MKRLLTLFAIIIVNCQLSTINCMAQAPGGMNYQAVARDAAGAILANQNICVDAHVTDGNGGPDLYVETANLSTNQFGLFTMNIGATDPAAFKAVNWAAVTPWLHVLIDIGCTSVFADMGTSQLLSIPYAMSATKSDTATVSASSMDNHWAVNGNDIYNTNPGNVLVGTTSALGRLGVSESGLGVAAWFEINNISSNSTTLSVSTNGNGNCLLGFQGGNGRVAYLYEYSTTDPSEALYVRNEGLGIGTIIESNNTANATFGLQVTQKGTGEAAHISISNATSTSNALYALSDGLGASIAALNSGSGIGMYSYITGTGTAGNFAISNAANTSAALIASTNGDGVAGSFANNNAASSAHSVEVSAAGSGASLYSQNYGTGPAGYFSVSNLSNTSDALYVGTNGSGNSAVYVMNTGTGRAGNFQINNVSNGVPALYAATNGSGPSVWGYNTGTGLAGNFWIVNAASNADALFGLTDGTGNAVHGQSTGTGSAGVFDIQNTGSSGNALMASTFGTGQAGYFYIGNASNANSAIFVSSAGTGKFIDAGNGAYLSNGGVWTNASDVNLKENITEVDGAALLAKLALLPVTQWNYKREGAGVKHIGPMAQDFYRLFSLGNDAKSISTIDPAGVALAAVKEQQKLINELRAMNEQLQKRIAALENQQASGR